MDEKIVTTTCSYDCGGRCILKVKVKDGKAVNITSENGSGYKKLSGCIRGRNNLNKLYHPDRLKYPLKRVGQRGSGKFERISWDEALGLIKEKIERVTKKYGSKSKYIHYSTGQMGVMNEKDFFRRLMCFYSGGFLDYENSYSTACIAKATPYTYGTALTASSRDNWLKSKLIILIGHNPAETVFDTNTMYYLLKTKEKGAKIVVIDPRHSDTVRALADEWIPIKPTTDNALFDGMTYVMIKENLYDKEFVDKYCLGFDEDHMPEGVPENNSLKSYILGISDGVEKTPKWAEKITGIPEKMII
ncbi:MAG: molybdopterin-dependent oxidoreductase, partial [Eubacteriales bacterium]